MANMDMAMMVPETSKDPNYIYSWIPEEPKSQTVYRMQGYEIVLTSGPTGLKFKDDPRAALDGKIRIGDVILMRCPKKMRMARDKAGRDRNSQIVRGIREEFHATAAALGVPSHDEDKP